MEEGSPELVQDGYQRDSGGQRMVVQLPVYEDVFVRVCLFDISDGQLDVSLIAKWSSDKDRDLAQAFLFESVSKKLEGFLCKPMDETNVRNIGHTLANAFTDMVNAEKVYRGADGKWRYL